MDSGQNSLKKYDVLREVYLLSDKIIRHINSCIERLEDKSQKEKKDTLDMFLKVGGLLCKIIALEHKIGGTKGISYDESEKEEEMISEEDIKIMKNYLIRYEANKSKLRG